MSEPRYTITRGRSERFNFTLVSDHGRISGSVRIELPNGMTRAAMNEAARRKIKALIGEVVEAASRSI